MGEDQLLFLLNQSREKNLRLGITGMLLYKGGNFMQMLEGEKAVVLELYETIRKDDRHKMVITVMTGDIARRNFEDWSMGFCNMDKVGSPQSYDDYIRDNLTLRAFQDDATAAYHFMLQFHETN